MGWIAVNKEKEVLREETHGRPVQEGEEGNLLFIMQEDFGHKVAVDLVNGVIIVGYEDWAIANDTVEIYGPRTVFYICSETNIIAEFFHTEQSEIDKEGWYTNTFTPMIWRPIWFTRTTAGTPTKCIGAQTTLPKEYGGGNVKKLVSIFQTGALGID
jgi:hypothetical protein